MIRCVASFDFEDFDDRFETLKFFFILPFDFFEMIFNLKITLENKWNFISENNRKNISTCWYSLWKLFSRSYCWNNCSFCSFNDSISNLLSSRSFNALSSDSKDKKKRIFFYIKQTNHQTYLMWKSLQALNLSHYFHQNSW